ncbi:ParB/RepB/Spo0J family partition protein [Helicobacter sp. 23-1048]
MAKNRGLGRGLSAVFGEVSQEYENNLNAQNELVLDLSIENIKPNPHQPRKTFEASKLQELADSIKEHGLLQPVVVQEGEGGEYILIAGERRLRASKLAGLSNIRAVLLDSDAQKKLRELALIENIQREGLNPIELAQSYQELLQEYNITQDELASRIKKSRPQIANTLGLLKLEKFVQDCIIEGKITQGHAKVLVTLSPKDQKLMLDSILGQKLSVQETESLVRNIKDTQKSQESKNPSKKSTPTTINQSLLKQAKNMLAENDFKVSVKNNQLCITFSKNVEIESFIAKISH